MKFIFVVCTLFLGSISFSSVAAESLESSLTEADSEFFNQAVQSLVIQSEFQLEAKQAGPLHQTLLKLYKLQELGSKASRMEVKTILKEQNPAKITQSDYQYYLQNEISGTELPPYTVVLTFDDGPHDVHSLEIADELRKNGAPATFFEVGENIEKYPHITQELKNRGFLVGNHSLNHLNLTKLDDPKVFNQISSVQDMLDNVLNGANYWTSNFNLFYSNLFSKSLSRQLSHNEFFRTPYGARSRRVLDIIKSFDVGTSCFGAQCSFDYLQHVVWLIDSLDWADKKPDSIEKRVFNELSMYHNRGIILFHDIHPQTVAAIKSIVPRLIKEGYKILTMYDALAAHGALKPPQVGQIPSLKRN